MSKLIKTYYDINKLVIWGDENTDGDQQKRPKLVFSFRDGNPRITVYTGVNGQNGVISFPSDYPTMVACMNLLKDVCKSPPGTKFSVASLTTVYENDKPTKDKRLVSTLYIGKSKEGIVYISVIAESKPKLVFSIKPSPFHAFYDSDKNPIPDSVMSEKIASGIADLVLNIISGVLQAYTEEEYNTLRKPTPIKSASNLTANNENLENMTGSLEELDL